ncbi:metallophosphoesterase [Ectobacillus polymachus]|uniref:metallophosphoesterase n=1 Tax=Ectobacillus polymachus TaxID=1508806 RepID=UPI003A8B4ED6
MNRRTFIKKGLSWFLYSVITTGVGYIYARYIEPTTVSISKHTISSHLIKKGFIGKKIVQFSDCHLGYHYSLSQLKATVQLVNEQSPDIILFTGDLIDDQQSYKDRDHIAPILKLMKSSLGKFAIYGNHDHGGYGTDIYAQIMNDAGFQVLQNEETRITLTDDSAISIVGIDDMMLGHPKIEKSIRKIKENIFTILLVHEPDVANTIANYPIDLQLSGHSHGGQVQLPFLGPIITPPLAKQYVEGFYQLTGNRGNTLTLYVNRGLGTTRVPFRFLAKPEITVFQLQNL